MCKVSNHILIGGNTNSDCANLDTLAQLRTGCDYQALTEDKENWQKRAKAKAVSDALTFKLVDLDSPLKSYYWNAYWCSRVVVQEDNKLTAKYCNTRHCSVCNRIRTAKAINGYKPALDRIEGDKYFLTLTRQSIKEDRLERTIRQMTKYFRDIQKNMKNTYGIKLKGVRKIEMNNNPSKDTYNPHFHTIVAGKPCEVLLMKSLWLNKHNTIEADIDAQDLKKCDEGSTMELFKYFSKFLVNGKVYPAAIDVAMKAMKGKRTIQPFGGLKKVSEDVDELESQEVDFIDNRTETYYYENDFHDWVSDQGELLTEYQPTEETLELIEAINNS